LLADFLLNFIIIPLLTIRESKGRPLKALILLPISFALASCGGTSTPVTLSDAGYANAGDAVVGGTSYTIRQVPRVVGTSQDRTIEAQDIAYKIARDGDSIEITLDGTSYTLPTAIPTYGYAIQDGPLLIAVNRVSTISPVAEALTIFSYNEETDVLNDGDLIIGLDTNPATLAQEDGSATFTGELFVTLRNGDDQGFGQGDASLSVNFDTSQIAGTFTTTDSGFSNTQLTVPDATFALEQTDIDGNGFAGKIRQLSGDTDANIIDSAYAGNFFGSQGETVGGIISARLDEPETEFDTLVSGSFVTNKRDQ